MEVTLQEKQVQRIQLLLSNLIQKEIQKQLNSKGINSPFMNKKQTCIFLGISNNTLDSWIRQGLPSIKIGKTVRFNRDEIIKWMNSK
ncbi:helix-turn-helix transcriptional regulator [Streptococcus anginosus]|uniref:helix-turn-helix transcriptional regulator n=1 Tax=Streptococcus anginosus TaxID=1328 RepID=UPI00206CBAF2|nr:helix-turn-helix domain-containing protein [Streptococcus anginosus]DAV92456.1 MAG TPA: DNA packaging protein [Caudoviricetes sp.]